MLLSISLILLSGLLMKILCEKIKLPGLIGMIAAGALIGPFVLDLLDNSILGISSELRKIALIIILLRAGLTLNITDLKKVGRPAILMCFLPACFEICGMLLIAPKLMGITLADAAVMGAVVAAVSPAVIVPRMIKLIEEGYGTEKGIPQLILAGASVDDVFVIVLFGAFTGIAQGEGVSAASFAAVPVSVILGIALGLIVGKLMSVFFRRIHIRDTVKIMIMLSVSFIFTSAEDKFSDIIPFSALIAVMFIGIAMNRSEKVLPQRLSHKLNKLWVGAEIFLFVLVGASVNIKSAAEYGMKAVLLILAVLVFRLIGVLICLIKTNLNFRERLFCVIAYIPKATVQAAIGGLPLAMGLECGGVVLTVSVLAIMITAPIGAWGTDFFYKRALSRKTEDTPTP